MHSDPVSCAAIRRLVSSTCLPHLWPPILLHLRRYFILWDKLVESAWGFVAREVCCIAEVHINDGRVVNLDQLASKPRQQCQSSCVEHKNEKGIASGPSQVVYLKIGFASAVKRWAVIGRDELKELHEADKLISDIHKHQLAVDLVDAIHCDCHEIALVVAAGKKGAIDATLTFWQHAHVFDLGS